MKYLPTWKCGKIFIFFRNKDVVVTVHKFDKLSKLGKKDM